MANTMRLLPPEPVGVRLTAKHHHFLAAHQIHWQAPETLLDIGLERHDRRVRVIILSGTYLVDDNFVQPASRTPPVFSFKVGKYLLPPSELGLLIVVPTIPDR